MKLSDTSIQRPVFASMMSLALVLFGALGYQRLTVRELPDVDPPIISVATSLRGANPRVMESSVTDVLEEELSTIEGLRTLTSSSAEQSSNIVLEFTLGRNIESAAQDVRDKVNRVRGRLPVDIDEPVIAKQDADAQAFYYLSLSSPTLDLMQLSDIGERVVKQRLQTVAGVGSTQILGQRRYSMRVWLDPDALAARGLTVQDVAAAIRSRNVEVPAGRIESEQREFTVRSLGELRTPEEFGDLVVSNSGGALVKLRDLSRVELAPADTRSAVRYDGDPAVGIGVVRQSKANLIDVSTAIQEALPMIQAQLPSGVTLSTAFDQAVFVKRSIADAERTLLEAALLVVVIIFLFLRNLRATLIPAFAIPTSIIAAFAVMYFMGYSVNNFTLLALTIAIGIVVDDAIIVLENAYRHQEELGEDPETAARRGTGEISFAVVATTASLMAVFVPLAFLKGNTGRLFNEFGIAVAGSVLISGFVALTLTPMLCARILRVPKQHGPVYRVLEGAFDGLANGYRRSLGVALRYPAAVVVLMVILIGGAWSVYRTLKREFIPADDRGVIFTNLLAPEGSTIGYTDGYQRQVEEVWRASPETQHVFSMVGRGSSPNGGIVVALLHPWEDRKKSSQEILTEVRPKLGAVSGVMAFASSPQAVGGFAAPVQFIVRHPNYDSLLAANTRMLRAARTVTGLVNVDTDLRVNKPELTVNFDRDRAEDLGVPVADVAATLQTLLGGSRTGTFTRDNKLYDVLLQLDPTRRATPQDMTSLYVRGKDRSLMRLDGLARIEETTGPRSIAHFDRVRAFTLSAAIAPGYTLGEAIDTLRGIVESSLPAGTTIALGGESRELAESGDELVLAFGLAIIVVFMVLASQFESLIHPFTVLMAVPLAVLGAIFTLKLAGATINLYSQIGMILLVGLVTKNSILLVDYANQLRSRGADQLEAMLEAGRVRFRPILITSVAAVVGALPIALGLGTGSASRRPLGYAIVGGIFFSTALTLFVVPVVWHLLEGLRARRRVSADVIELGLAGSSMIILLTSILLSISPVHHRATAALPQGPRPKAGSGLSAQGQDHGSSLKTVSRPWALGQGSVPGLSVSTDTIPIITLAQALSSAVQLDPLYVQSVGTLGNAEWARRAVKLAFILPVVNVSSSYTRLSTQQFNLGTGKPANASATASIDARYELFNGFRNLADASRTRADLDAAEAGEVGQRFATALEVERTYYDVLGTRELLEVARDRRARATGQLATARARVTSGATVQSDSLQVLLEVQRAEVDVLQREAALTVSRLDLGRRVGQNGPVDAAALDTVPPPPLPLTLDEAVIEAADHGPARQVARANERSAEAQIRSRNGSYFPTIALTASLGKFDDKFFPSATTRQAVGISLTMALWDGGQRELALERLRTTRDIAHAVRADLERRARHDVTEAYAGYSVARRTLVIAGTGVAVAGEVFRVQQARYRTGAATVLELLDAQSQLAQAQADLVQARYRVRLSRAGLEAILGRRL